MRARSKIIAASAPRWYHYLMTEQNAEKIKKTLAIIYVIGLVGGFIFVNQTLKTKSVDVITKGQVELKPEIKKIQVTLDVKGLDTPVAKQYEMTTADSSYDLLQAARKEGDIYFETIEYVDRFDIKFLDRTGQIEYQGNLFLNGESVIDKLKQTKLLDGQVYTLRLTR
jgi:hypothetical protein